MPEGFIRSLSHFCHSISSSSISTGEGGSSRSGGTNAAAPNERGTTPNQSQNADHNHILVPSSSEMDVSLRGCFERVLVAISPFSYKTANATRRISRQKDWE